MMLHEECTSTKNFMGRDAFTRCGDADVVKNLNPPLTIREYQKEALGRLDFYMKQYQNCKK